MTDKHQMSLVKLRVRTNALKLREFTAMQMAEATGLGLESVRTELQRMREKGLLTAEPTSSRRGKRGRNVSLYRLTSDPDKLQVLAREVESFYPELTEPTQPTSHHYLMAKHLLDLVAKNLFNQVIVSYTDKGVWAPLLEKAEKSLESAKSVLGKSGRASEAFIQFEKARLLYVRGYLDEAKSLFQQVKSEFLAADFREEVSRVDEYITSISIRQQLDETPFLTIEERAKVVLESIQTAGLTLLEGNPVVCLLAEKVQELANYTPNKAVAAAGTSFRSLHEILGIEPARVAQKIKHPTYPPRSSAYMSDPIRSSIQFGSVEDYTLIGIAKNTLPDKNKVPI